MQVQALLKKGRYAGYSNHLPLHGPILKENLGHYIAKYDVWSSYQPEDEGGIYRLAIHPQAIPRRPPKASAYLRGKRKVQKGGAGRSLPQRFGECVEGCVRYLTISCQLPLPGYDAGLFPLMEAFLPQAARQGLPNRVVALIENGSWAPSAGKWPKAILESMKTFRWWSRWSLSVPAKAENGSPAGNAGRTICWPPNNLAFSQRRRKRAPFCSRHFTMPFSPRLILSKA